MSVANHENSRRPIFSSLFLNFIRQLLIKFLGFFILLVACMILIIMFSYDTKDPSFRSSTRVSYDTPLFLSQFLASLLTITSGTHA